MSVNYSQLNEPVTQNEIFDQAENIESILHTQRALFDRVRVQYGGDSDFSNEMWNVVQKLQEAHAKVFWLWNAGVLPP